MPFLANEDQALKLKLQGLFVHDATAGTTGRPVVVRFKNPEYELADAQFPLILISHVMISKDQERESRGRATIGYAPEGYARWADMTDPNASPYTVEQMPIPLNIDYRIDVHTRKQQHMIELTASLMQFDFLADRYGYLVVPQDGTVRRLDLLAGPEYVEGKDELGKRLFSASWSVRVSSEIFLYEIAQLTPVDRILMDLVDLREYEQGVISPLDPTIEITAEKLQVTTTVLPDGRIGIPYQQSLNASGGTAPYTWSIQNGTLPAGLQLAPAGIVFGTPTVATPTPPPALTVAVADSAEYGRQSAPQQLALAIAGS